MNVARARWYVQRARSMPPGEFLHRAIEAARRQLYRRRPPVVVVPAPATPPRSVLLPVVDAWQPASGVAAGWARVAENLRQGRVVALGVEWPLEGGLPCWRRDPVTGRDWPRAYCFDIDYRHGGDALGDVKFVWEINRLLYLLPAAAHARSIEDRELAALVAGHVRSWTASSPPYTGVGWGSGIECAMRVLALVAVDELLQGLVDAGFADEVRRTVLVHVDWIARFPSLHSSANNHRLAELTGQLLGAARYPRSAADEGVRAAWDELVREGLVQTLEDGVSGEQATGYAAFALEWLALAAHAARALGLPTDERLDSRLSAALTALGCFSDASGELVRIGDHDEARLLTSLVDSSDLLAALHHLVTGTWQAPARPLGVTTFAEGGYTAVREGLPEDEVLVVLDHGPLGLGSIAAHAHADTLSLWLHHAGRPLLVDAGTYLYHAAGHWRDSLRSTALHNTVQVGGRDSSTMAGAFNWSRSHRATGRLLSRAAGEHWALEAEHDGYVRLFGVVHRRRLERVAERTYRITDRLVGPGQRSCTASLLLAPDVTAAPAPNGWTLARGGTDIGAVRVLDAERSEAWHGSAEPERGWCSPRFGELLPAWQLAVHGLLGGDAVLRVEIELWAPS